MAERLELVLGTAGHIDHGKTALVKALTGVDTDRLPAERQRGITIDLGFAALELGSRRLALIDVPGHERFIRNLLAGASGLDLALMVVAADDGVMPQTREHLEILTLLGLGGGAIALTKSDLADETWLQMVEDDVRALVAGTVLADAPIVRTSAATGQGIDDLKRTLADLAETAPDRIDAGLFRMAIDRAFSATGHGTVVTGTVASGSVAVGQELILHPEGRPVRVRGLQAHGEAVESIGRGGRAAINLAGVRHDEVARGHELAEPAYLEATRVLSVALTPSRDAPRSLRHRGRYKVHLGTAEVSATLSLLDREPPTDRPALAQLLLAAPVVAVHGQPLVLREESPPATVGGARVLLPGGRRLRRKDRDALDRLVRLNSPDPAERLRAALASLGRSNWTDPKLVRLAGIPLRDLPGLLDGLRTDGTLTDLPLGTRRSRTIPSETLAELEGRVEKILGRLHEVSPRQSAIARPRVIAALADLDDDPLATAVIERMTSRGRLVGDPRTVALKSHTPKLSQGERKLKDEIWQAHRLAGMAPPDLSTWTAKTNPRAAVVPELLTLLREEGRLVEIGRDLYLDADADAGLRQAIRARLADGSALTVAEIRDLLGITRKHAVPISEYLDRIGMTVRDGDLRRLGPGGDK